MTDHPMLFSAPMVRASLDGRKTNTRRIIKNSTILNLLNGLKRAEGMAALHMPIQPGDRIWVKENYRFHSIADLCRPGIMTPCSAIQYEADKASAGKLDLHGGFVPGKLRPSIHMPKWASRLTLHVTDVRVQRLQDISDDDCIAEGIEMLREEQGVPVWKNYLNNGSLLSGGGLLAPSASFLSLWNSINGPDAWDANPWVVAYTFNAERRNVLELAA